MRSVSIVTLTKNRANLLDKCLASIVPQLNKSDEMIIVDNGSTDNTQSVLKKYKNKCTMHVYSSKASGYPNLYNEAIHHCSNFIVVFLDDDCVAFPDYIANIKKRYITRSDIVIQGETYSLPKKNIYAEISEAHLRDWIFGNTTKSGKLKIIDNRNVAIPRPLLIRYGGFSRSMKAGSEDVELGMRLYGYGIPIEYDRSVRVFHTERSTLWAFLSQRSRIARSHAILDKQLPIGSKILFTNSYIWVHRFGTFYRHEAKLISQARIIEAIQLPCVYLLLVLVRSVSYLIGKYSRADL